MVQTILRFRLRSGEKINLSSWRQFSEKLSNFVIDDFYFYSCYWSRGQRVKIYKEY